ncbi:MAG: hypothetical protein A2X19_02715 [Bacteroidetes bacterium GWE2_39_28]|nr:MAG: hypothetical protein A2X19_02715 [Bacteroidetes bacterium GWE2_39_28]OFY16003.1 MAG: hypothetical protein A2X16_09875 [Bacteroidetes bacterium GWF2_39_10]OFZ07004.1 MAG: hypothetical protein A2322_08530 [Bacteroidetes bacterium RIFOXYB2_FULL_39_7]OFZ09558.1 MAG: hypothetical protein A2465_04930 [Bacteroidetes bacterium RIFOXYC2_FULL_39_11]HCT94358.1 hypothetical protein [Rikenellaceae bacterium]
MAKKISTEERAHEYVYRTECKECLLVTDYEHCNERPTCHRYNVAAIDYTAGYNDALKTILIRNK